MKLFFLGVDGGGTKTEFLIIDEDGREMGFVRKLSCHYKQTSLENFKEIINSGIIEVCKKANIKLSDINFSVFGVPGYGEIEKDKIIIENIIEKVLDSDKYKIVNDVEVGWAGSLGCKAGINIVAGTGSIAYGRDKKANSERTGGWGHHCGDEGSAYWLGKKLIEVFTKQSDGRMERAELYNIVKRELNIEKDFEILDILLNEYNMERNKIARLSLILYKAVEENDKFAKEIYDEAAYEYFLMIKSLIDKLEFDRNEKIIVSYSGGVFNSKEYILEPLKKYISNLDFNIIIKEPLLKPISGAVLMAFKEISDDEGKIKDLIEGLKVLDMGRE